VVLAVHFSLRAQEKAEVTVSRMVPFVGCISGGQADLLAAPTGTTKALLISPDAAQALAYYQCALDIGVLAPRGWHCLGIYGSGDSGPSRPQVLKTA
jgi:hypothetical protein